MNLCPRCDEPEAEEEMHACDECAESVCLSCWDDESKLCRDCAQDMHDEAAKERSEMAADYERGRSEKWTGQ